jgi:hypothetical protein
MNKIGLIVVLASELALAGGSIIAPKADLTGKVIGEEKYKYVKKPITIDDGNIHGYIRMHHIFSGENNTFDPGTGSTLGLGVGYGVEIIKGLKVGIEAYGVMDSGLTETDGTENVAYGQFMNTIKMPTELDTAGSWGAHIRYEGDGFKVALARSQFKSPMTKTQITHVPNMYEYARVDADILGGNASLAFISKMAYGSRSAADFGLIGEKTATAGMSLAPFTTNINGTAPIERGKYYSIDDTLKAGTTDSSGIFVFGYEKKMGMLTMKMWDFLIDDVGNNLFVEGDYKYKLGKGKVFKLSAHVWNQNISNDSYKDKYGGTMVGAEALLKWGAVVGKFAYESKDEGGLLNAWGANPGYTSSIFSRNEYRADVNAYKATIVYKPLKNLKFMASYANYGQSSMVSPTKPNKPALISQTDATETDLVIVYKPWKQVTLKLFNVNRTSEYSTTAKPLTQNHTRLIMNYAF